MPTVSVVIAAYQAEKFIETAVRSVLEQTLVDIELLVVVDGATDDTHDIVKRLACGDRRVRVFHLAANRGKCYARNIGLTEARGDWIAILDADDWLVNDRLETLSAIANQHDAKIVADNQHFIKEGSLTPWRTLFRHGSGPTRELSVVDFVKGDIAGRLGTTGLLKPMVRRSLIDTKEIRYNEEMRTGEDFDFTMRCLAHEPRIVICNDPKYFYRIRRGSTSNNRTLRQLMIIHEMNCRMARGYSGRDAAQVRDLLRHRGRSIKKVIQCRIVVESLAARRWRRAFTVLRKNMGVLPFIARRMMRKPLEQMRLTAGWLAN